MKIYAILLLILSLSMAFTVKPSYIDIKNTGDPTFDELNISLKIDCDSKQLTAIIENEDEELIANAKTYVFYTDYGYQLIGTGTTDEDGVSEINIIGNMDYLKALFIFRADATGYQSQEIEFTYLKCFSPPPADPDPPEDPLPPQIPENPPQTPPTLPPQNNTPPYQPPVNNTPYQPPINNTASPSLPEPGLCPIAFGLLFLVYKVRE